MEQGLAVLCSVTIWWEDARCMAELALCRGVDWWEIGGRVGGGDVVSGV